MRELAGVVNFKKRAAVITVIAELIQQQGRRPDSFKFSLLFPVLLKKKKKNFTISFGVSSLMSLLTLETAYGSGSEFVPHFPTVNTELFIYSKTIKIPLQIGKHARDRPQTCFQFKNMNLDFEPVTSEKKELSQR